MKKPYLIWDSRDCCIAFRHVSVTFAPATYQPFAPAAVVEEQDTYLIMGEQQEIVEPEQPAWVLANQLDTSPALSPGTVLRKGSQPLRLLAIIHDVEQSPTTTPEWIEKALATIFSIAEELSISSLKLPLLATSCHNFSESDFFKLLLRVVAQRSTDKPLKIWMPCKSDVACKPLASCLLQFVNESQWK